MPRELIVGECEVAQFGEANIRRKFPGQVVVVQDKCLSIGDTRNDAVAASIRGAKSEVKCEVKKSISALRWPTVRVCTGCWTASA